nr:TadE/TadG family type IV pilus assembly protein [Thalassovita aquimarina]
MSEHGNTGVCEDQQGTILVETLIVVPVLIILSFGLLEFGNMLWQRMQLQAGVRDAARYWSRCANSLNGVTCSQTIARNIAFYGQPTVGSYERVVGWNDASELTITPATPPSPPGPNDVVTVTGRTVYRGSPVMGFVLGTAPTIEYSYQMRFIGW